MTLGKYLIVFLMIISIMSFGFMSCDDGGETVSSPATKTPSTPTHITTGAPLATSEPTTPTPTLEPTESPTMTDIPTPTSTVDSGTCVKSSMYGPVCIFEMTVLTPQDEVPALVQFKAGETLPDQYLWTNPISWEWDFGDGATSNIENPVHEYSSAEMYHLTLTTKDCSGRKNTRTRVLRLQAPYGQIIVFNDPGLEEEIRENLDWYQGDIYESHLEEIKHIDGIEISDDVESPRRITYLSGIEYCKNLTILQLRGTGISDISPLSKLANLHTLDLSSNEITDISPLIENTGLGEGDWVDIMYNPLSEESINEYIPQLEQRGVMVDY